MTKKVQVASVVLLLGGVHAVLASAGNVVNAETVELSPIPVPVEFACDMDKPVAFDAKGVRVAATLW